MKIKLSELIVNDKMNFVDLNKQIPKIDEKLISTNEYPHGSLIEFYRQIE